MEDEVARLRWSVRRRLEFIDSRLFWSGRLNRLELCSTFGISIAQASADIARYERLAPSNVIYDRSAKQYRRTPAYEPALVGPMIEAQLFQGAAIEEGVASLWETWLDALPPMEIVSLERQRILPIALLRILDALRGRGEVEVASAPDAGDVGSVLRIAPHGLFRAAGRWHVRAWARERDEFLDVDIHGSSATVVAGQPDVDPSLDLEWLHSINLVIVPNPGLSVEQRATVAARHSMVDGRLVRPCRLSLVPHLVAAYDLDIEPGILTPERQPLVFQNEEEVHRTSAAARTMSAQALARHRDGRRRGDHDTRVATR